MFEKLVGHLCINAQLVTGTLFPVGVCSWILSSLVPVVYSYLCVLGLLQTLWYTPAAASSPWTSVEVLWICLGRFQQNKWHPDSLVIFWLHWGTELDVVLTACIVNAMAWGQWQPYQWVRSKFIPLELSLHTHFLLWTKTIDRNRQSPHHHHTWLAPPCACVCFLAFTKPQVWYLVRWVSSPAAAAGIGGYLGWLLVARHCVSDHLIWSILSCFHLGGCGQLDLFPINDVVRLLSSFLNLILSWWLLPSRGASDRCPGI